MTRLQVALRILPALEAGLAIALPPRLSPRGLFTQTLTGLSSTDRTASQLRTAVVAANIVSTHIPAE